MRRWCLCLEIRSDLLSPHVHTHATHLINPTNTSKTQHTEIAFVGDGPDSYQIWLGGSPALTRVAYSYQDKCVPVFRCWALLWFWLDERSTGRLHVWVGVNQRIAARRPVPTHTHSPPHHTHNRVKMSTMDDFFTPLFQSYKQDRKEGEAFGDWAWRLGKDGVKAKVGASA